MERVFAWFRNVANRLQYLYNEWENFVGGRMNKSFFKGMATMCAIFVLLNLLASFAHILQATEFNGKIFVNNKLVKPKNSSGEDITPLAYKGAVYLPVRAISEALNVPISWDGDKRHVYIGRADNAVEPAEWLLGSKGELFNYYGVWEFNDNTKEFKDSVEQTYSANRSVYLPEINTETVYLEYNLNGKYRKLTGVFSKFYEERSSKVPVTMTIYLDDAQAYTTTIKDGSHPIELDLNIEGKTTLRIEISSDDRYGYSSFFLSNFGLWP